MEILVCSETIQSLSCSIRARWFPVFSPPIELLTFEYFGRNKILIYSL